MGKQGGSTKTKRGTKGVKPFKRILIVCEGEKTEPNYFKNLCSAFDLKPLLVQIEIDGECGSSPQSVVGYAKEKAKKEMSNPYDKVYCVFDRDKHPCFNGAIKQIKDNEEKLKMEAIVSYPCFEYWYLLHFEYTTPEFGMSGGSPCDDVVSSLKRYIESYSKGDFKDFDTLFKKIECAKQNAKKANQDAENADRECSKTDVVFLIEALEELKRESDEKLEELSGKRG